MSVQQRHENQLANPAGAGTCSTAWGQEPANGTIDHCRHVLFRHSRLMFMPRELNEAWPPVTSPIQSQPLANRTDGFATFFFSSAFSCSFFFLSLLHIVYIPTTDINTAIVDANKCLRSYRPHYCFRTLERPSHCWLYSLYACIYICGCLDNNTGGKSISLSESKYFKIDKNWNNVFPNIGK